MKPSRLVIFSLVLTLTLVGAGCVLGKKQVPGLKESK